MQRFRWKSVAAPRAGGAHQRDVHSSRIFLPLALYLHLRLFLPLWITHSYTHRSRLGNPIRFCMKWVWKLRSRCGTTAWSTARRALLILSARNVIEKFARRVCPISEELVLKIFKARYDVARKMRFSIVWHGDVGFFTQIHLEIFKSESKEIVFRQTNQPRRENNAEYLARYLSLSERA